MCKSNHLIVIALAAIVAPAQATGTRYTYFFCSSPGQV